MTDDSQSHSAPVTVTLYANRLDVTESCADVLHALWAENGTVRAEFCANRFIPASAGDAGPQVHQVTSARLVMSIPCALALLANLNQMEQALLAQGTIKVVTHPETTGQAN